MIQEPDHSPRMTACCRDVKTGAAGWSVYLICSSNVSSPSNKSCGSKHLFGTIDSFGCWPSDVEVTWRSSCATSFT